MTTTDDSILFRFGGIARLYGERALQRLTRSHVLVVGVGGVGSWAVEALARSGVGRLTLVDDDDVCVSNTNRQLIALSDTVGRYKVDVLKDRIQKISENCRVDVLKSRFNRESGREMLGSRPDFVVDAIDGTHHKVWLAQFCRELQVPLVISGSAGGRVDPTRIRVSDLNRAKNDPMLARLRKLLRQEHGWSRDTRRPFGVNCVYSEELPVYPSGDGCVTNVASSAPSARALDCATGLGTATHVTGIFGFLLASVVVKALVAEESLRPSAESGMRTLPIGPLPS